MLYQPADTVNPHTQAAAITLGLMTFVTVGLIGCFTIIIGIVYLFVNFVLIALQAILETITAIAHTYASADPIVKLVLLVLLFLVVYRAYRTFRKKGIPAWIRP